MGENMGKLDGKTAIVTGAGQGIGRGIALAFAKEGAGVVIAEIVQNKAQAVAKEIQDLGKKALAVVCDVSSEEQIKTMVDQTVKAFGSVDILVNTAQGWGPGGPERSPTLRTVPLEDFPEDLWDHFFITGVKATFLCCKAVFPYMKNRGGKIINFGSSSGILGQAGQAAYAATKEAIRALSRTAAREWGKYKINVNVICPGAAGPAYYEFKKKYPELIAESLKSKALGRIGDPEKDIGRVAVFLASEDSDYITGGTIMVDGGSCMYA
jgi:NAD(P)-dependent dehydrogenase (short-subunit alcohol dehydrogenase family)